MSNIIPFEQAKVPATLMASLDVGNDLVSSGGGFPVISIKGKVFHIKRGDEVKLLTKPDADDEPAASIEVVILDVFPGEGKTAKTYYSSGYVDGSDESPTCYSNDGIAPAADAAEPQSKTCQTCPHAVWGSKISENGKKTKACSDVKRLAVAAPDAVEDAMLLRVPAASLSNLTAFNDIISKRGYKYPAIVTKIGFDHSVAHPQLTFKPIGVLSEDAIARVVETRATDLVKRITGRIDNPPRAVEAKVEPSEKPAAPKPAEKPAKPAEKAKPAKPAAPAEPAPAPKKEVKVESGKVVDADAGLDAALADIDFDD